MASPDRLKPPIISIRSESNLVAVCECLGEEEILLSNVKNDWVWSKYTSEDATTLVFVP